MARYFALFLAACWVLPSPAADAALIILNNKDAATVTTTGSQATFGSQGFTPNVAGPGLTDNVTANSPLPANVFLTSITLVKAPAGTATAGQLFLDIYTGAGNGGTYIGSSLNSFDVNNAASLSELTWQFPTLLLSSSTLYNFAFSTDNLAGGTTGIGGRVAAANFGGGFVSTYSGGVAYNANTPSTSTALDARFLATFETVPEPSHVALLGVTAVGWLYRRRRHAAA